MIINMEHGGYSKIQSSQDLLTSTLDSDSVGVTGYVTVCVV